ncbi:MAG TPA: ATP-binding protein [Chitinophagaceae bacterium]|nr:ATP-binding protein [Chitinophagaceae bacterium]
MSKDKDQQKNKMTPSPIEELESLKKELAVKNREIEVEKALENVRAKALQMRSSSELSETSIILFQQLKELNIDVIRSGLGILDEDKTAIELWVTVAAPNGHMFFILDYINIHVHPVFENIVKMIGSSSSFSVTRLEGKELENYYKTMSTYSGLPRKQSDSDCEYFYSFFFSAGTINVVVKKEMTEEEKDIMIRMTGVFGLLYTRFLDLKKSEEQAKIIKEEKRMLEQTLVDLKATQSQLIQSEKMASLGELTAGIAHEIQNPLNFVNNFSEVNTELIEEMKEQLAIDNKQQAIEIANDISENEKKINHHGKRADAIVKGMLQHSRSSSGVKEPTDINKLADEYLRLAYHGLRAKDKSFNATMKTDFDESIGNINIIPQDIGRVILNLITNAFYVVDEKKKQQPPSPKRENEQPSLYEPIVVVTTKKLGPPLGPARLNRSDGDGGRIEIRVADNGNGIPQNMLDKIFQPFFTTKPTGQGTGLGLSLSYDIVKAHGGEIKVNTKENEGTEFTIILPA